MALATSAFKADLKDSFVELFKLPMSLDSSVGSDSMINQLAEAWATKLSSKIETYIKTGTVDVTINNASVTTSPVSTPGSGTGEIK